MASDNNKLKALPATALAVYQGKPCPVAIPQDWAAGGCEGQFRTSLDLMSQEGRKLLLMCMDGDVAGIDGKINVELDVYGFTFHPISLPDDETGEVVQCVRSILHTKQGDFKAVSAGVLRSMNLICGVMGRIPPWSPPIKVIPRRIPTSGGRSRYMLEMVE